MDFHLTSAQRDLQARTRAFIAGAVMPLERDPRQTPHGPTEALRDELVALARQAGLLTPHASTELGGLGLSHVDKAIVFEEAGYSTLGPTALNIHAPDEGNVHLMEVVANAAQRRRWLEPLVQGRSRSCFCMTEPPPGAGSDPGMLRTTARREGDHYVIDGEKIYITGATGAGFAIIMARTDPEPRDDAAAGRAVTQGATMFLADMKAPGITVERRLDALDACFTGGHGLVRLRGLRVPASDVLGEVGQGLRYAQVRLAPARLTHCMRWLGQARRAHDVAVAYARQREAFGHKLIGHEGVSFMLADNEMDLHVARLTIWHCAWLLDQGEQGRHESSVAKVICSEAVWRVVDRSVQVLGGSGVTGETLVSRIFADMRAFRIYDGPSEVHRWRIGNRLARGGDDMTIEFPRSWSDPDIELYRSNVVRFIEAHVQPHDEEARRRGHVGHAVWRKAGELSLLCADIPEEYGGGGGDFRHEAVMYEEMFKRSLSGMNVSVHSIVAHYLLHHGTEAQKRRYLPRMARGEWVGAIAMTEPGAGSDLQGIRARAERVGDEYVINGTKTFITNGFLAGVVLVVVKTDPGERAKGISILILETEGAQGYRVGRVLDKIGMKSQDTSELFFDDVRVPAGNLLGGKEGQGFFQLMKDLPYERLIIGVTALAAAEGAYDATLDHVRERKAFGKSLFDQQNTRYKLAEVATQIAVGRAFIDRCIEDIVAGKLDTVRASMAKLWGSETQGRVIDECLQLFGGYGYMNEYLIARMYADARVQRIYGGTSEIMKEVIARAM